MILYIGARKMGELHESRLRNEPYRGRAACGAEVTADVRTTISVLRLIAETDACPECLVPARQIAAMINGYDESFDAERMDEEKSDGRD